MRSYKPAPVDAREILRSPVHFIAFGFGAGLSAKGPGTVGTLVGLPFWLAMQHLQWPLYLMVVAAFFAFGCWVCGESAKRLGVHDHGGIVFDEIIGYLVTTAPLLWLPIGWMGPALAFVLFRVFDILKPWPIRWLDARATGGFGIMVDDLVAGIMAAAVLQGLLHLKVPLIQ